MFGKAVPAAHSSAARVAGALICAAFAGIAGPALAQQDSAKEREALKACERQICEIVVKKDAAGSDFACSLSKTWSKSTIQGGIEKKRITWGFGDARCVVDVGIKRTAILEAMSKPTHTIELQPQTVKCQVEREKDNIDVAVTLAPKLQFKDGKAEKAWINVKQIEAPAVIRGAIWTVAQAENYFGLFHGEMIAEINEFLGQKCQKAVASN